MQKDFITVTPDSGTKNATVAVTAMKNTGNERNSTITISASGMKRTVKVSQDSGFTTLTISIEPFNPYATVHGEWSWKDSLTNQKQDNIKYQNLCLVENILSLDLHFTSDTPDDTSYYITIYSGKGDGGDFVEGKTGDFSEWTFNRKLYEPRAVGFDVSGNIDVAGKLIPLSISSEN